MTPLVIRMMIMIDATSWSITYDHHSDNRSTFIIHATPQMMIRFLPIGTLINPPTEAFQKVKKKIE
jgi:hypothetical protein